ncbi:MAG: ABC transporter permease subunit [Mangrovicoccus sp.]|nr:ABC transporter permease subunit [Mangrovicoccus sp.]
MRHLLGALAILMLWQGAALLLEGRFLLAGPWDVARYMAEHAGLLGRALRITLLEAFLGFVIGNGAALILAVTVILLPRLQALIGAVALLVFCLPLVATGPILRVLWGPGIGPQVTLAALAVYYTSFLPLVVGLRAAPASWFDLVESYGRGPFTALVIIRLRACLPYFFAGLQIAAPAAFLGAMVGEFTGAERGMGVLAIRAMRALDVEATWALASLAAGVSILFYSALGAVGHRLFPDRPALILSAQSSAQPDNWVLGMLRAVALGLASLITMLLLWWAMMELGDVNRFFGKRPADIWHFLVTAPEAAAHRATLWQAAQDTLRYTLPGYGMGLALGLGLAAIFTLFPTIAAGVLPLAIALRAIPIVTTAPLIVLALGRGATGTITIVAVMIFFPTLVAALQGMRQAPGQVLDLFDSYGASRFTRLILAQIPAMLPAFFAAARMAVPAAILAVTVAEWLATGSGLGNLMALTASTSDYNMLWSSTALVTLLAGLGYALVAMVEKRVLAEMAPEQGIGP